MIGRTIKETTTENIKKKALQMASSCHFQVSSISRLARQLASEASKNFEYQLRAEFEAHSFSNYHLLEIKLSQYIESGRQFFFSEVYGDLRKLMLEEANKKNTHLAMKV
ncbi:hypothetical protein pah_c205o081 [Parachlamydia acanthamoebae str. Hall's coccus]|nr:hypothetical protein pah_c205o081 [Parachlamydia acanthamoebae str. Hall's coccus]